MKRFKIKDGGSPEGYAVDGTIGGADGTRYKAEYYNDNIENLLQAVIQDKRQLVENDIYQLHKAIRGRWSSLVTYNTGSIATQTYDDVVLADDGLFYKCLKNGNIGNNPTTSPTNWGMLTTIPLEINKSAVKSSLANNDLIAIVDSAKGNTLNKTTMGSVKNYCLSGISLNSSNITDTNTYTNFTPTANTQQGVNRGIDNALMRKFFICEERSIYNSANVDAVVGMNIRNLNTIIYNDLGFTLSNNQITVQPGKYYVTAYAVGSGNAWNGGHRILIKNLTANNYIVAGTHSNANFDADVNSSISIIDRVLSFPATTIIELHHEFNGTGRLQVQYGTDYTNTASKIHARIIFEKV